MRKCIKMVAVMAGVLLVTAGSEAVLAVCTNFGPGFAVFQCTSRAWFAPTPTPDPVTTVWWQLGYGNAGISNGVGGGALEGTGIAPVGVHSGNDSGSFNIVMSNAKTVLVGDPFFNQIPNGALCSNYENSWSQPGVDGCVDVPRTAADDDNLLNKYFSYNPFPEYYSLNYQVDYPMGILLKEGSGDWFALAFLANSPRGTSQAQRATSVEEGFFDLGKITNGETNPAEPLKNNQIPWQRVPKLRVDATTFTNPADKLNSDRMLQLSWTADAVEIISDGSVRPSGRTLNNPGNGVGVLDQGPLVRYIVEAAPITSSPVNPGTLSWAPIATTGGTTAMVTVPPDTALRLRTAFGKTPQSVPVDLTNSREGKLGDLGFDVTTPNDQITIIAGPLISERALEVRAVRKKNLTEVSWSTTSEISATGFTIIGKGAKGEFTIKQVACKSCTTGNAASYVEQLTADMLKGAKSIKVRMNGPDTDSAFVTIE